MVRLVSSYTCWDSLWDTNSLPKDWKLNTGRRFKTVNASTDAENTSRHIFGHKVLVDAQMKGLVTVSTDKRKKCRLV